MCDYIRAVANEFGPVLIDVDSHDVPMFRKIATFTEAEQAAYMDAHTALQDYMSQAMLLFVRNESVLFLDYVIDLTQRMVKERRIITTDQQGAEVRDVVAARVLASANAYFTYREQRREHAKRLGDLRIDETATAVGTVLDDFYKDCASFRWMVESRNALVHLDLRAVMFSVTLSLSEEPMVIVKMAKDAIAQTNNMRRANNAHYRQELQDMTDDPMVFDLLKDLMVEMPKVDQKIRDLLYPEAARLENARVVRELISKFQGERGIYCLQTGEGFTQENPIPPHVRLSEEVLSYAASLASP